MPRLRATRYLTCFYCGKRSNTKFDGVTRDFLCLYCDATNYLDENGDITDPPVATEREAPATQYANPRASSPVASQNDVFCSTCLKNQRLFTTSLAQYFPDDPSDPDYPALERNYYRFRKGLEARYPQVCEECAERVEGQIRQAGYTAKTDHLRRMVEKSRKRTTRVERTTGLDWANNLGRGLWWGGLVFQMLWHLKLVSGALKSRDEGMYDPDDRSWPTLAVTSLAWLVAFLPPPEKLMNGAFMASILSAWWNPKFVQATRGFTRHLLGFTQWYSFQGLIIFFRFIFQQVLEMDGGRAQSRSAQLSAHLVMAVVMSMIYMFARNSIRIDTTPLFGTHTPISPSNVKTRPAKKEDPKTFSEMLNEALDSPSTSPNQERRQVNLSAPYLTNDQQRGSPTNLMGSFSIGEKSAPVQYSDEMDWTPTQTEKEAQRVPSRPFGEASQNWSSQRFGETPVTHESPFWYKVPAAPTTPARQLRNPNAPIMRSKPVEKEAVFFPASNTFKRSARAEEEDNDVSFKQPTFFAQSQERSEDSNLADLLNQSFSISPEPSEGRRVRLDKTPPTSATQSRPGPTMSFGVEFVIIACLLGLWLVTVSLPVPFARELQLALLSGAGTVAIRITGETAHDTREEEAPSTAVYVGSVLSVVELAAVCWLGWEVWMNETDAGKYGIGVLMTMLAHQFWNTTL
ncbi:Ima1 N-terminal domain-containing protein [Thelonectria olida]|uniref:Ima1 N-terminal domain-containing protein n=1 Tax=Thelonectria olida TaxID=1576542 RepID=A0A9P9AUC6_9HYPO|nr:Ima1 N-terminal domain-containing protein [Thelonectria olida]